MKVMNEKFLGGLSPIAGFFGFLRSVRSVIARLRVWRGGKAASVGGGSDGGPPLHLRRGSRGEAEARRFLTRHGLKFLTANFRSRRGEIDLIFRDRRGTMLVFVEVKTRSQVDTTVNPTILVSRKQQSRIARAALDYLRLAENPDVAIRFDVVEVHCSSDNGRGRWVCRHVAGAFGLPGTLRYMPSPGASRSLWRTGHA